MKRDEEDDISSSSSSPPRKVSSSTTKYGTLQKKAVGFIDDDNSQQQQQNTTKKKNYHVFDQFLGNAKSTYTLNLGVDQYLGGGRDRGSISSFSETSIRESVKTRVKLHNTINPSVHKYKSLRREIEDSAVWRNHKNNILAEEEEERDKKKKVEKIKLTAYDPEILKSIDQAESRMVNLLLVGIGISVAIVGLTVSSSADYLLERKIEYALADFDGNGFMKYLTISLVFSFIAFVPIAYRPIAAGSGIAEAKATLNGIILPDATSLMTGFCKGVSVIFSVAASLPAGLEGPMIHLGLVLGANATRFLPSRNNTNQSTSKLDRLRTERHHLDFTAIGTAAGVTTAFFSPIGGVLFVMEEGSSFWSQRLTWRCFIAACVAIIAIYYYESIIMGIETTELAVFGGMTTTTLSSNFPDYDVWEYILFALLGALGGLTGAFFCVVNRKITLLRQNLNLYQKCLQVLVITAIVGCLTWYLPLYVPGVCREVAAVASFPEEEESSMYYQEYMELKHLRRYNCPEEGQYNDLATLFLNPLGSVGINLLFREKNGFFTAQSCVVAGLTHFLLLLIVFGTTISAGIFIPLLFAGACLGRAFAILMGGLLGTDLDECTYAIIGSAACLGGVVRVLISLTVIIANTTGLSYFTAPIMITTLMSRVVATAVSGGMPGIYDIIMKLRGIPFLEEEPPLGSKHLNLRARNIMQTDFPTISSEVRVKDLMDILRSNPDVDDFPVVREDDEFLLGIIERLTVLALLTRKDIFYDNTVTDTIEEDYSSFNYEGEIKLLTYTELEDIKAKLDNNSNSNNNILEDIERDYLNNENDDDSKEKYLYITPYAEIAPHTFDGHGSVERAYEKFRLLGLRTMLVLDYRNQRPIGIITRHKLNLIEEIGEEEHHIRTQRQNSVRLNNLS